MKVFNPRSFVSFGTPIGKRLIGIPGPFSGPGSFGGLQGPLVIQGPYMSQGRLVAQGPSEAQNALWLTRALQKLRALWKPKAPGPFDGAMDHLVERLIVIPGPFSGPGSFGGGRDLW